MPPDFVEKVQPSISRGTVPGSEWAVTPKPQGLVRSLQDSGLVG